MTKKRKKKHSQKDLKTRLISPSVMKKKCKYTDAFISTLLTLGGIYASFFTLILIKDRNICGDIIRYQSLLGGLFVNLFAVISVAYSKFSNEIFIHRNIYWLSLLAFTVIISIFAQARLIVDPSISLIIEWFRQPCISVILQVFLAILIFIISAQQKLDVSISYNKKKLN